jgi:hypothetical protein
MRGVAKNSEPLFYQVYRAIALRAQLTKNCQLRLK